MTHIDFLGNQSGGVLWSCNLFWNIDIFACKLIIRSRDGHELYCIFLITNSKTNEHEL